MSSNWKETAQHITEITVIVVVVFLAAIGLTYLEDLCKAAGRPQWLIFGMEVVSALLFIIDAVLVLSLSGIWAYFKILKTWTEIKK